MKECPICGSIMSFDEIDWGCYCCGGVDDGTYSEDEEDIEFDHE